MQLIKEKEEAEIISGLRKRTLLQIVWMLKQQEDFINNYIPTHLKIWVKIDKFLEKNVTVKQIQEVENLNSSYHH